MANKSLTDLTARTATADSDLLHINSGGTDYKELKSDFLHGSFGISFDNTSLLTAQVDALNLPNKSGFSGIIEGWGHASETGLPVGATYYVSGYIYLDTYKVIEIWLVTDPNVRYQCSQQSGTWGSWTQEPTRDELEQRLIDISSQFTWNTSLSAVNKGVIAYYDPYNHSVRGSFYINVSSSFASTAHMLVAPSGYRPSSNSAWIGVLSTTSKDTNFYYGSILTDGKFTQSLTSVCMGAYGQFEYKI